MNFEAFLQGEFDRLAAQLPAWSNLLGELRSRFNPGTHGDFARWRAAFETLDSTADLAATLRQFMPWRKGPWQFRDVFIDTEWRSDWKWRRLAPHLGALPDARILDVGCGNGYFGWQLRKAGARAVVGIDPTLLYCMQHLVAAWLLAESGNWVLPLTLEALPEDPVFDPVLSLGVIYHRRDPLDHVRRLFACTAPGGRIVLESLVVEGDRPLHPADRYARMRNVPVVPTTTALVDWLAEAGFMDARVVDVTATTVEEQRTTTWMTFESLAEALDPADPKRTVEGYPAPVRAIVMARKPADNAR